MAFDKINVGAAPNDGTGDKLRVAFQKINQNYDSMYTQEEIDQKFEEVDVDLSNYDTKQEVNTKIELAVGAIDIPKRTSQLINDGNGVVDKPFITIDEVPAIAAASIDEVLRTGNISQRSMRLGNVLVNSSHLFYKMQIFNASGTPVHQWALDGEYQVLGKITIDNGIEEGVVEFNKNSDGIISVFNTNYNRSTVLKFATISTNATVIMPNKSGTIALLTDIPAPTPPGVPEAPMDGNIYGRSSGTWVPVSGGTTPIDPTNQNIARSGTGYKLITRTTTNVTFGANSLMFGTPVTQTFTSGADSAAFGENQRPEGVRSFLQGSGNRSMTSGTNAVAFGGSNIVQGNSSAAIGFTLNGAVKVGQVLVGSYSKIATENITQQFIVAIGTSTSAREHGLEVLDIANKGFVRAPFQKAVEMNDSADDKILVHKEFVEFYYTPRLTFDDLESRVDVLENASSTPAVGFVSGGTGIRRTDTTQGNYGNIGSYAVDFSIPSFPSNQPENYFGATASGSFAAGSGIRANGQYSVGFGLDNKARRDYSFVAGNMNSSNATVSATFGFGNTSIGYGSLTIGRNSTGDGTFNGSVTNWNDGDEIFKVGNGTDQANKANAYVMYNDGTSTQNGVASYGADYSSTYTDRSLVDRGFVLNPTTFIELLTNTTPTQLSDIKALLGIS